jgi:hypothetical protein
MSVPRNPQDNAEWERFSEVPPRLGDITASNKNRKAGWISRKTVQQEIPVWKLEWFAVAGNFLLSFPTSDTFALMEAMLYLPEATLRRCPASDETCAGRPQCLEIVSFVPPFAGGQQEVEPLVLSFESLDALAAWEAALMRITSIQSALARMSFGLPRNLEHKVHINATEEPGVAKNFGGGLLGPEMAAWMRGHHRRRNGWQRGHLS